MDFDYEWDDTMLMSRQPSNWVVTPDLDMYTDEELLDTPAHILAARIREAAFDGRLLVIADPVTTTDAVVRIPDREAQITDYNPTINWSHVVEHPPIMENTYGVNTTLVNAAIPYRVIEPELPDKTRVSTYEATAGDVALSAVERCVVRGFAAIQAIQRGGGDASGLAQALNAAWGGVNIFTDDIRADFLGDVSISRYLAKSSKRKFQLYRNIGWLAMVSPGSSLATTGNYGLNSVINWQRRVELACYYVHIAMMLEGENLPYGTRFGITARIPDYGVQYANWECCAMTVIADEIEPQNIPLAFRTIAEALVSEHLDDFLNRISNIVYHHNRTELREVSVEMLQFASKHSRLVYIEPYTSSIVKDETSSLVKSELAMSKRESKVAHVKIATKSHDPSTAVLEGIFSSLRDRFYSTLASTAAYLAEVPKIALQLRREEKMALIPKVVRVLNNHSDIVYHIARSLKIPTQILMRNKWENLLSSNIPKKLIDPKSNIITLLNMTAFQLLISPDTKAAKTAKFWAKEVAELLSAGVRGKTHLVVGSHGAIQTAIVRDIAETTKSTYNNRYRSKAHAYADAELVSRDLAIRDSSYLSAVFWYLLADFTQAVTPKIIGTRIDLDVSEGLLRKSLHTALSKIGGYVKEKPPLLQNVTIADARKQAQEWLDRTSITHSKFKDTFFEQVMTRFQRYLADHAKDFSTSELEVKEPIIEPAMLIDIAKALKIFDAMPPPDRNDSIEAVIGHFAQLSEVPLEDDDLDSLEDYWHKILDPSIDRKQSWIQANIKVSDKQFARDKLIEWLALLEGHISDEEPEII